VVVVALALAAGCRAPRAAAPAGPVRIDGSTGVMPLAVALADAYRAAHPGATVVIGAGLGATARLDAVAAGRIDVALASHGLEEAELARRGLTAHEVARVAVVFATHAGVPVRALTQAQLCDVYAGRITDWRTLGGPALAIAPRTRPTGEVDGDVVREGVPCLRDATGAHVPSIERPEAMAAALADTPGAIGMTSLPFVERSAGRLRALALDGVAPDAAQVRSGAYPLTRRSVFVTRADASPAARAFLAFVRGPAGARVIAASGAVAAEATP
jgi:phosphate transport system substrate-binding protein